MTVNIRAAKEHARTHAYTHTNMTLPTLLMRPNKAETVPKFEFC